MSSSSYRRIGYGSGRISGSGVGGGRPSFPQPSPAHKPPPLPPPPDIPPPPLPDTPPPPPMGQEARRYIAGEDCPGRGSYGKPPPVPRSPRHGPLGLPPTGLPPTGKSQPQRPSSISIRKQPWDDHVRSRRGAACAGGRTVGAAVREGRMGGKGRLSQRHMLSDLFLGVLFITI
ncbi:proline-rich protein 2-like [Ischnura elegans]|uniref:proline-rich protein 2-like n=1 Tax=Ischnura elegans TaxID=197161 RepID=UPI001ED86941|nr:proline-rich protein 2-like [Ischnura elegans]